MRSIEELFGDPARKLLIERIEAAIKALPARPSADPLQAASRLRLLVLDVLDVIERVHRIDRPQFKPITQNAINKELDKLTRLSTALGEYIDNMHSVALAPVEGQILFSMIEFRGRLRAIAEAAERVDRSPKREQQVPLVAGKEYSLVLNVGGKKRGARTKGAATWVAGAACAAYEGYTGKRATITTDPKTNERRGDFVVFVNEIFAAAGIKANAVNYAKQAADIRRKVFGSR